MTNHVPTLETCQRLKAVGFPQETAYAYVTWIGGNGSHLYSINEHGFAWNGGAMTWHLGEDARDWCAAPLLTEILEQLPFGKTIWQGDENYFVSLSDGYGSHDQTVEHINPVEAAALLYLELKENS